MILKRVERTTSDDQQLTRTKKRRIKGVYNKRDRNTKEEEIWDTDTTTEKGRKGIGPGET